MRGAGCWGEAPPLRAPDKIHNYIMVLYHGIGSFQTLNHHRRTFRNCTCPLSRPFSNPYFGLKVRLDEPQLPLPALQ